MAIAKEQLQEYRQKLQALQAQCAQAEKDVLIAETNLKNYKEQQDKLVEELEAFTNHPFEEIPELLKKEEEELQLIMNKLMAIDVTTQKVDENTIAELQAIIDEFNIPQVTA